MTGFWFWFSLGFAAAAVFFVLVFACLAAGGLADRDAWDEERDYLRALKELGGSR